MTLEPHLPPTQALKLADAACVLAILQGNRQRYAELVERYQRSVYAIARAYIKDAHSAEDAAQEIFVNAYSNLKTLREPAQFAPWLMQIARHHAARLGKQAVRRLDRQPLAENHEHASVAASEAPEKLSGSIWVRLEELPEPYRSTLQKKYMLELTCREIAAQEGVKVGTITSRLTRGIEILRSALKPLS